MVNSNDISTKPIFFKPRYRKDKYNFHSSKFRKALDIWNELNLIDIIYTDSPFCWLNRVGNILLFDFDYSSGILPTDTAILDETKPDKLINVSNINLLDNIKNIEYLSILKDSEEKTNDIYELDFDNLIPDNLKKHKYGILSSVFMNKKYKEEILLCLSLGLVFIIKEEDIDKLNFSISPYNYDSDQEDETNEPAGAASKSPPRSDDCFLKIYEHFLTFETVGNELYDYNVISNNCKNLYEKNYSYKSVFNNLIKKCYIHDTINLAIDNDIYDNINNILNLNKNYTVKKINFIKVFTSDDDKPPMDKNTIVLKNIKGIQSIKMRKEYMYNEFYNKNISSYITNIHDNYDRFMPCPTLIIDKEGGAGISLKDTLQIHIQSISLESFYVVPDAMRVIKPHEVEITPFINIITQYCNHKDRNRQNEFDICVLQNLNNKYIENVYLLNEPNIITPKSISEHPKCVIVPVDRWLTYKMAFDFSYNRLLGKVCILCNLDIFIDPNTNWKTIESTILDTNIMFCLSRYEFDGISTAYKDPNLDKLAYCNAQDAWVFKGEFNITLVNDCDFEIGLSGCDNAIADRLYKSGYVLVNSPNTYKIFHFDICRQKDGNNYVEFHRKEDILKTKNSHPEKIGYRLLPDIDKFKTLASAQEFLGITGDIPDDLKDLQEIEKYTIICNMFTKKLILNNN